MEKHMIVRRYCFTGRQNTELCRSKRNIQHNRQTAVYIIGASDDEEDDDEVNDYEPDGDD